MARVLSFLIRYFSNYNTLLRSDLAARAAPLESFKPCDYIKTFYHKPNYFLKSFLFFHFFNEQLLTYQNKRKWRIAYNNIKAPAVEWDTPLAALKDALEMEKAGCKELLEIERMGDAHLSHFIDDFISRKVDLIKELGSHICELKRCGEGLGVYQFDMLTMMKEKI